ncbi:MAG: tetratricopeptide repeat protein [Limisphaerales bacterium]
MNSPRSLSLSLIALVVLAFGLAAWLQPQFQQLPFNSQSPGDFWGNLLDDSRYLFANSAYVTADEYYHSGFYPTIFDNSQAFTTPHMAEDTGAVASRNSGDEMGFMGPPRDWIDAFGRHFIPNRHTHLDEGGPTGDLSTSSKVSEILPWLKLSAELDPEDVKTFVVTAFWLRTRLNQTGEAEQVLRQGLRSNPGNPQLLFELGRVYFESYHDIPRARTIWEAALRTWRAEAPDQSLADRLKMTNDNFDDRFIYEQLQVHLANLEQAAGNYTAAINRWKLAQPASPAPAEADLHIKDLEHIMAAKTNAPALTAP